MTQVLAGGGGGTSYTFTSGLSESGGVVSNTLYGPIAANTTKKSVSIGTNNTYSGQYALAAGNLADAKHQCSAAIGYRLETSADNQIIVGRNSLTDANAVFIVANGTYSNRSNAFTVKC